MALFERLASALFGGGEKSADSEAERTLVIFEWYVPPDKFESSEVVEGIKLGDQTQQEDGSICEVVQKNLHSRSYDRGRYSVKQEKGVHHFHRLYASMME